MAIDTVDDPMVVQINHWILANCVLGFYEWILLTWMLGQFTVYVLAIEVWFRLDLDLDFTFANSLLVLSGHLFADADSRIFDLTSCADYECLEETWLHGLHMCTLLLYRSGLRQGESKLVEEFITADVIHWESFECAWICLSFSKPSIIDYFHFESYGCQKLGHSRWQAYRRYD